MRNKGLLGFAVAMLVTGLMLFAMDAAADPSSGTWKINSGKSKYSPGPAPQTLAIVVESDENNYKVEATGVDGDGKPIHVQYSAKFDGKDYPAQGIANADTVSVRRVDANTIETMEKKNGKVVMLILSKVSKDGKTRVSTWRGLNADGKDVRNVVVFDKQ